MHEYGPTLAMLLAVFAGIWLNRRDYSDLKADMTRQFGESRAGMARQFAEVDRRLNVLESDYKQFYWLQKHLEGRVELLSKR